MVICFFLNAKDIVLCIELNMVAVRNLRISTHAIFCKIQADRSEENNRDKRIINLD
jgi:hypothetical protein